MSCKKGVKRESRKTLFGIKLPPIEKNNDYTVKTILDIDPEFYSLVEGRPIKKNTSINKYKENIKNIGFKKVVHGYIVDEILRIDREIETERNIYDTAYKHFEECLNSFNKFLAYDNNKTIDVMKKSDTMAKDLANQTEDHRKANYELASIKSKVQYIDESLQILLSFEYFLHKAAPILWQQKENIDLNSNYVDFFSMDTNLFCEIDIDSIKNKLNDLSSPCLYFGTPEQLLVIFELLEKQNTNYLLLTEELNSEKNKFLKAARLLKESLRQEFNYIQHKIIEIEELITMNAMREDKVKNNFFDIFEEKMRYLISSDTVLQIHNYVEYTYEKIIVPNDINLSSYDMISALKMEYENLLMDLSTLDLSIVKVVEKEIFENGLKEMKQAREASKLLKNVDKLSNRLKASYEPSRSKTQANIVHKNQNLQYLNRPFVPTATVPAV